jgi:GntR family transcriptional regulator
MDQELTPQRPTAVPLYRQVKEILIGRIAGGSWAPGAQVPAEPRLAAELGVSAGTVRKALDEMVLEGLVTRRQGAGTFVASASAEASLFRFFKLVNEAGERFMPSSREVGRRLVAANGRERALLDLANGAKVVRVKRLRFSGQRPIMTEQVTLPVDRVPRIQDVGEELPNTLYDFYEDRLGVTIRRADETLRAVAATADDAGLIEVAEGQPLLEIERLAYSFAAEPVELRLSRLDSRHYAYLNRIE